MQPNILLCITVMTCFVSMSQAQTGINGGKNLQGLNGAPLTPDKITEMVGTYYYKTVYLPATLVDASGKEYTNQKVKLNQQTNQIFYLDKEEKEMESISDIRKIIFFEGNNTSRAIYSNFGHLQETSATRHFHHNNCEGVYFRICDHTNQFLHVRFFIGIKLWAGDSQCFSFEEFSMKISHGKSCTVRGQYHVSIFKIGCLRIK